MSVDIKRLTAHLSPQQQAAVRKIYRARAESSTAAFISCFFLGVFGAHRFYLKQWRQGFLHLLLAAVIAAVGVGGLLLNLPVVTVAIVAGILLLLALLWVIVDLVRIDDEVASHNIKLAEMLIAQTLLSDHTVEQQADAKLESLLHETAAQAEVAANYGRMHLDESADKAAGTPAPSDTAAAAPIPAIGVATGHYDASTVTQISDDPNATQHGGQQAVPETAQQAVPHAASSVETDTVSDMPAEAALAGAALAPLVSEAVTHTHEVSGYSVTDGVETMTTASIPEPQQPEHAPFESEVLPTNEEATAATWPNRPPMELDAPATTPRWVAPDVTDRGEIGGDVKPVADIVPVGVLPLHVALDDTMGTVGADGEGETHSPVDGGLGAAFAAAAMPAFAAEPSWTHASDAAAEPPVVAVEPAASAYVPADEGLLFLVPEEASAASPSFETPAESYIPPVVPVVSTPGAYAEPATFGAESAAFGAESVPAAYEAALEPLPMAHEPPAAAEPEPERTASATPEPEPGPEHHTHTGVETLAELGAFAGLAGLAGLATSAADEAVSLARAHRESLAAAESQSAPSSVEPAYAEPVEQAAPAQPETLAEVAALPAPTEEATPAPVAAVAEPEAKAAPAAEPVEEMKTEPELMAVSMPAAAAGMAAAADAAAPAPRKLKRVRVVRQLKVDGKVVEENFAEEYIDPDADPEPVKARLREQLRLQAEAHTSGQSDTNG